MSTNGRRMISLLEEGIGFDFLRTVSRGFLQAYREAFAYAYRNYDSDEAHDVCGHIRKANIEKVLKTQANVHDLEAVTTRNKTRNYSHTEVRGGAIVLTAARTEGPSKMVPEFEYRLALAASNQLHLFEPAPRHDEDQEGELYGVILHRPLPRRLYMPAFLRIAFPTADFSAYTANVDLLWLCRIAFDELDPLLVVEEIREEFQLDLLPTDQVVGEEED